MSQIVYVNYGDGFHFYLDLKVDELMARHYAVTDAEHAELVQLQASYERFQQLLQQIQTRPELEYDFNANTWRDADIPGTVWP